MPKSQLSLNIKQEPKDGDGMEELNEQQNMTYQGSPKENKYVKLKTDTAKRIRIRKKFPCPNCSYVGANLKVHLKSHSDER